MTTPVYIIGDKQLPCGHHGVVLDMTDEPQLRVCGTCRRRYWAALVVSEAATEMCNRNVPEGEKVPVYKVEFKEKERP